VETGGSFKDRGRRPARSGQKEDSSWEKGASNRGNLKQQQKANRKKQGHVSYANVREKKNKRGRRKLENLEARTYGFREASDSRRSL